VSLQVGQLGLEIHHLGSRHTFMRQYSFKSQNNHICTESMHALPVKRSKEDHVRVLVLEKQRGIWLELLELEIGAS
jgi:hypothetical protein